MGQKVSLELFSGTKGQSESFHNGKCIVKRQSFFLAKSSKSFKKSYENLQEHFSDFSDHNEILSF